MVPVPEPEPEPELVPVLVLALVLVPVQVPVPVQVLARVQEPARRNCSPASRRRLRRRHKRTRAQRTTGWSGGGKWGTTWAARLAIHARRRGEER